MVSIIKVANSPIYKITNETILLVYNNCNTLILPQQNLQRTPIMITNLDNTNEKIVLNYLNIQVSIIPAAAFNLYCGNPDSTFWIIAASGTVAGTMPAMALLTNGTNNMLADLNMGGNTLINLDDPINPSDGATKSYVDASSDNINYLLVDGSRNLTGNLNLNSHYINNLLNPVNPQDASTKSYVDASDVLSLKINGSNTMLAALNFGNNQAINLIDPTVPQGAATKHYVDVSNSNPNYLAINGSNSMTGDLKIPSSNVLIGNQSLLTNPSILTIAQSATISTSSSGNGVRMQLASNNANIHFFGVDASGYLTFIYGPQSGPFMYTFTLTPTGPLLRNNINANNFYINNLPTPINSGDAATKNYVDTSTINPNYLLINGSNGMGGSLNLNNNRGINTLNPVNAQDIATKNYVDTSINNNGYLKVDGSNDMLGSLNMDNNFINNVTIPINLQDAATKGYVDQPTNSYMNLTPVNTLNWIRAYTISGTEGSVIDFYINEKNSNGTGSGGFQIKLIRDYTTGVEPYSAILYPWTAIVANIAVNAGEIWVKKNYVSTNTLSITAYIRSDITLTTLTKDGVTNQSADPTGFIDTSAGPAMYFVNGNKQLKGVTDPTLSNDAATKNYVDTTRLAVNGSNDMTASLNMNTHPINNVTDPTNLQDAATKHYVDISAAPLIPIITNGNTGDASGWSFTSSALYPAANSSAYYAFSEGNVQEVVWSTGTSQYITMSHSISSIINGIYIMAGGVPNITAWLIEGSNNGGSTFTTIYTGGSTILGGANPRFVTFTNNTSYNYYRLNLTYSALSNSALQKVQLYGKFISNGT
jgi:hypothetical protein